MKNIYIYHVKFALNSIIKNNTGNEITRGGRDSTEKKNRTEVNINDMNVFECQKKYDAKYPLMDC